MLVRSYRTVHHTSSSWWNHLHSSDDVNQCLDRLSPWRISSSHAPIIWSGPAGLGSVSCYRSAAAVPLPTFPAKMSRARWSTWPDNRCLSAVNHCNHCKWNFHSALSFDGKNSAKVNLLRQIKRVLRVPEMRSSLRSGNVVGNLSAVQETWTGFDEVQIKPRRPLLLSI